MSAQDALAFTDAAIATATSTPIAWTADDVQSFLAELRDQLTRDPEWSEVQESNLRAELAAAREELLHERLATAAGSILFGAALRHVEGERDRARATAIRLEQECAALTTGTGRRAV